MEGGQTRQERAFKPAVEAGSGREAAVREEEVRQEGEGEVGRGAFHIHALLGACSKRDSKKNQKTTTGGVRPSRHEREE